MRCGSHSWAVITDPQHHSMAGTVERLLASFLGHFLPIEPRQVALKAHPEPSSNLSKQVLGRYRLPEAYVRATFECMRELRHVGVSICERAGLIG